MVLGAERLEVHLVVPAAVHLRHDVPPNGRWTGCGCWRTRGSTPRVPEASADLLHAIYDRIVAAGRSIVAARLTPDANSNGLALALPQVVMARPTGVGRALTAYDMHIEGRDEWLAAARRLA